MCSFSQLPWQLSTFCIVNEIQLSLNILLAQMVHIEVPILCTHLVLVCMSKACFITVTKQQAASLHTIAQGDNRLMVTLLSVAFH